MWSEEDFLKSIKEAQTSTAMEEMIGTQEVIKKQDMSYVQGGLVLPTQNLRLQALEWCHTHPLAGHPGYKKTLDLLQRQFW